MPKSYIASFVADQDDMKKLIILAKRMDLSVSQMIRMMIREEIRNHEPKKNKKG